MKTKIKYNYHLLSFTWFLRRVLCQDLRLKDLQKFSLDLLQWTMRRECIIVSHQVSHNIIKYEISIKVSSNGLSHRCFTADEMALVPLPKSACFFITLQVSFGGLNLNEYIDYHDNISHDWTVSEIFTLMMTPFSTDEVSAGVPLLEVPGWSFDNYDILWLD